MLAATPDAETEVDIDDVKRLRTIGTGSFGRVYLVRHKETRKYYALKKMAIKKVVSTRQTDHVHSEKQILSALSHPFIVKMFGADSDDFNLYMLFEYIAGGELFTYLRNAKRFTNGTCRFYACEVILALEYLHSKSIVYRDLKPENLMLSEKGHIKLTDFGFAKVVSGWTYTLCGTPEYLAPEVIEDNGYDKAVDWWSLGILIYEMLVGMPPFQGDTLTEIYDEIMSGRARFLKKMDFFAKDLIKKLLQVDQMKRLGNLLGGVEDIKEHKWFMDVSWDDALEMKIVPPIIPKLHSKGDTSNFNEYEEESEDDQEAPTEQELDLFIDW